MITGRTLGLCIVLAACAWAFVNYRPPGNLKQQVQQQPVPAAVVLNETGIKAGRGVSTEGGVFTIRADRVSGATAKLTVSAKIGDVYRFDKVVAGSRLVVPAPDSMYDVDVVRIRDNIVYVAMSKRP